MAFTESKVCMFYAMYSGLEACWDAEFVLKCCYHAFVAMVA